MIEFNLSNNLQFGQNGNQDFIIKSMIKKFIKLEEKLFRDFFNNKISFGTFLEKRKKLIGDDLK